MTGQEARDDKCHELADLIEYVQTKWEATHDRWSQPLADFTASALRAAGYRKHPEPEITDEALLRFLLAYYPEGSENTALDDWPVVLVTQARVAFEAALRVPVNDSVSGEGEQE